MQARVPRPFQLFPLFKERVWGRHSLAPYFPNTQFHEPIGEAWFTFQDNETSLGATLGEILKDRPEFLGTAANPRFPGICPLLLKLIFTTERLSVQVHPDDGYAERRHGTLGKTEAWYVLDSQPPGEVAAGFREEITQERFRAAAASGEIETLLEWRKVKRGDTIFVPAGTVHAIGAGLTIFEVQENSDITYRLYDYGRPRELHLEDGLKVAKLTSHPHLEKALELPGGREELVSCPYFRMERVSPRKRLTFSGGNSSYVLLLCAAGHGEVAGQPCQPGEVWMAPANSEPFTVDGPESQWVIAYTSEKPMTGVAAN